MKLKTVITFGILFSFLSPIFFMSRSIHEVADPPSAVPYGPWVDQVDFSAEHDQAKALDMLESGDIDLYLTGISDPSLYAQVRASPNLTYDLTYHLFDELTFNPVGPTFKNGEFNPFSNLKIREAMNYLVNRSHIAENIWGGLAKPKLVPFISAFPEYQRLADVIEPLEARYECNLTKSKEIIYQELLGMGAGYNYTEMKWYYNGTVIRIKFLIRIEDARKQTGGYVADKLEMLGFETERMYRTSAEASPIWLLGDPADGEWHVYTGGWIPTWLTRDDSNCFGFFYTPLGGWGTPLWQAYEPDPIFYEVASKLWYGEWSNWDERMELMRGAVPMALEDSVRVWLIDRVSPLVRRNEIEVAVGIFGGFNSSIWGRTIRFKDQVGGVVNASNMEVLMDPWNPVAGSSWVFDSVIMNCVDDPESISNPYDGGPMPNRFENVTMEVQDNVYTLSNSLWLDLTFVNQVEVPSDAWFGWNVTTKEVITAPPGTYAKAKVVINYGTVVGNVTYHDSSTMSLADWLVLWPLTFERVDPSSPLYDESAEQDFQRWRDQFRGMKIIQEDPLKVEYYINFTNTEAEFMAVWPATWPSMPWHAVAIGTKAEEEGLLAFSQSKAENNGVEWMNYIGGLSLAELENVLDEANDTQYIPFAEHGGNYVTPEEASTRYENLQNWHSTHGHFWVASGPYYLDMADFTGHTAVVKAFREYTFKADRWAWLLEEVFEPLDLSSFPSPFVYDGSVNTTVIIGTSDPHGPCGAAHTLDTVGGMGVTAVLGTCGCVADCRFYLDTDIAWYNASEWKVHYWPAEGLTNMITTAGPGVNMITWRYFCNPWYAPVYMYYDGGLGEWVIATPTETYVSSDWIGTDPLSDLVVLEVIYVPEEGRYVLWVGGFGGYATRAGCLALQLFDSGQLPFTLQGRAMMIQWMDENGNAKVDPTDTWNLIEIVP